MNKLTKLLSVFVIAGAIGTGVAGVAGCKKTTPHKHSYTYTVDTEDATKHNGTCECGKDPIVKEAHVDNKNNETDAAGQDGKCDLCGAPTSQTPTPSGHDHAYEWTNNGDGTHSGHCDEAGCPTPDVTNEVHEWGEDHRCIKCRAAQPKFNITFNMHGEGTAPEAQEAYAGDALVVPAKPTSETKYFAGWYENADYTGGKFDFTKPASKTVELHARWLKKINISTVDELQAFRTAQAGEDGTGGLESAAYVLTADIDLDGVELAVATADIKDGVIFDGQGHTIKNATYNGTESKIGILCKTVNGGEVTDVKFLNCAITSTSETVAIIAGECNASSSFSKIEFNSCSAVTSNVYAGLIFGRSEGSGKAVFDISEITVKNGTYTSCSQYGGLLIGDIIGTNTVNFKDLHVDGEFKGSSGNGSFIAGRTRDGATVSVENAVVSAAMPEKNSIGIFAGGGAAKLNLKNVLIIKSDCKDIGAANKSHTVTKENVVAIEGVTITEATGTGTNTVAYLKDTLGLDFTNVWQEEGTNGYRLRAASTNVKSADAKLATLKISTSNAKLRFKKGEDFTSTGLTVMGAYSDGVQLVLTEGTEYQIVSSAYDKTTAGTYTITVKAIEDGATAEDVTYSVTVVEETGFVINHEFMPHVYLRGDKLDTKNLVLYSTWSDGAKEKVDAKEIKVVPQSYNMTTAGSYDVMVAYKSYAAQTVTISVIDTKVVPVDGKLYVNVDPTTLGENYSGKQVNGVETFANVADAIDYLEACNFDKSVQKVVRIAAGEYKAKITTDLDNLTLIGLGTNDTTDVAKLTYDAVESTVDPLTGAGYGMNCATFHVKGTGFKAYNIFFENSFDYITDQNSDNKESSPQGFALTINGDGAYIEHCHMYGNQDTLYIKDARAYFKDSQIDGNVDFIFGEGKNLAYFDQCRILAVSRFLSTASNKSNNGYVTAAKHTADNKPDYGYIFNHCEFTAESSVVAGSMSLGRPWGAKATVAMIECTFSDAYSTHGYKADLQNPSDATKGYIKGRWEEMSGNNPSGADFCEYGSTGEGAITTAGESFGGKVLTETDAAKYTAANLFAKTNGLTTWDAAWDYTAAGTLLTTLRGELTDTAGDLYVSSETVTVTEDGEADLLISYTPWNLSDKGITIEVEDDSIADYYCGVVYGLKEGETNIKVYKADELVKTIPVTVASKDPTIREIISLTFGGSGYEELTTANSSTRLGKKVTVKAGENGSFVQHSGGAKYYKLIGDASIEFTVAQGTLIRFTSYEHELKLMLNDTDVTANGTWGKTEGTSFGDDSYTYTAAEDGVITMSIAEGKSQLYLTKLEIVPPITKTATINVGGEEEAINIQGTTGTYKGMFIDGTSGKFYINNQANNPYVQLGAGAVVYIPTIAGSTVEVGWYSNNPGMGGANNVTISYNADKTLATLEFHLDKVTENDADKHGGASGNSIYIKSINVTCPVTAKVESFYVTSDDENLTGFTVAEPFSWDANGIIKLYSATVTSSDGTSKDVLWTTDNNGKKYNDISGTEHTSVKRLKSNGGSTYMTIDLTGYVGEYTLTFAYAPSNTGRTAQLAAEGEEPVFTVDNTDSNTYVANATATLQGGKLYKFTWTNAYNFYYMGIVPKA